MLNKHRIVGNIYLARIATPDILIAAAIITPTGDVVTLMLVALPLYALYEASIFVVPNRSKANN